VVIFEDAEFCVYSIEMWEFFNLNFCFLLRKLTMIENNKLSGKFEFNFSIVGLRIFDVRFFGWIGFEGLF
jgi:hypothetical protein